ncbi:MAG: AAA family ATPase [Deltaproteobacteria bacterium]|jgi:anion-transporting  ArsA/GET3 family ATPase|nr:AAA family ATPase [Deltaproteobacteria bacterium]MBK8714756.1 AAA family ATPase [Deltaproteobacteria bacterium]
MADDRSVASSRATLEIPASRRVALVVGPGGVGKTTVAAALAMRAAAAGRRTIVVTIDPSRRLAQALGLLAQDGHVAGDVARVEHDGVRLDALLLDTQRTFDTIVREHSPSKAAADAMLVNPIYRAMVRSLGGALEYAASAQVQMLASSGAYDLVVLDTPPTANAIDFLEAPAQIAEVANNPAAKFLAQSGRIGMRFLGLGSGLVMKVLESVGGGAFVGDLGRFLGDFGAVLTEFQHRAGELADLLVSPGTGVILTTAATDFSVREALAFLAVLAERKLRIDGVVFNRVDAEVPPWPGDDAVTAALTAAGVTDVVGERERLRALRDDIAQHERLAIDGERALRTRWPRTPVVVVPRVVPPPSSLADLRRLGDTLWV